MDKTAIRNFAIEARKILMKSAIAEAGFYGISKDGVKAPIQKGKDFEVYETLAGTEKRIFGDDIKRRENLANAVKELGFEQVIEETAYTWFNRIIAIRFMEVNNYLPTRVRVLSSETGSSTPDIVTQADTVELNMSVAELESIQQSKRDNKYDEAFRLLFIKQCNELNAILPGLFEKTNDYMELLLKIPYTGDGVIRMLIDTIPEDNFNVDTEGQVEIIGWMYQYYNTELKDDTFAKLKKNVKITKERIPAATQLFTPDWIVRYMVENSLGRVWIEHLRAVDSSVDEKSKAEEFGWKYYLPEAEQEENVAAQLVNIRASYKNLTPQDITCIDPCMGSGHILVYMFDVLMDIYRSEGFSEREAVFDILEKNIRGLDIDRRAYQLSYFALMMKARGYNRIFFRGHENLDGERVQAVPQIYAIEESNSVNRDQLKYFGSGMSEIERNCAINELTGLLDQLTDAREYGSILVIENYNWDLLKMFISRLEVVGQMDLGMIGIDNTQRRLEVISNVGQVLSQKYDVLITNPPYMASKGMSQDLTNYVQNNYPESKSDLFSCFLDRGFMFVKKNGFNVQVTMQVWMFLTAYEKFRKKLFVASHIVNLLHMDNMVMGIAFGTSATIFRKGYLPEYEANYSYATIKDLNDDGEPFEFPVKNERLTTGKISKFEGLPRLSLAYWITQKNADAYKNPSLSHYSDVKKGMSTADDNTFIRMWHEVDKGKLQGFTEFDRAKWYWLNKGGSFRRWYGNNTFVVDWENDGQKMKSFKKAVIRNSDYYFAEKALTWTYVTNYKLNVRYYEKAAFAAVGPGIFPKSLPLEYILGYLNTAVAQAYADNVGGETITYEVGEVATIPVIVASDEVVQEVVEIVKENIALSKRDWDSKEISWDFARHPLIQAVDKISEAYANWKNYCLDARKKLKKNEERLNEIFISLYGLNDELNSGIEEKDIVLDEAGLKDTVKTFISYIVGCIFGRYSLKRDGLCCAGKIYEEYDYGNVGVDKDAIVPITDEPYFEDDIVSLIEKYVREVYGESCLEENMSFIADALGTKGANSREKIRNYMLNDFYADHCGMYSVTGSGRRPIYWLFDSGKCNGFKCLMYIHRYDRDTIGVIRTDYLSKQQAYIENALRNAEYTIKSSSSAVDRAQATQRKDKYVKQLAEIKVYYPALAHIAMRRIELDLDAGIKDNYMLFQSVEIVNEGEKKQTVDLLAKI